MTRIENHLAVNIGLEPPRRRRSEFQSHKILRDVTSSLFRAFRSAFFVSARKVLCASSPRNVRKEISFRSVRATYVQAAISTNTLLSQTVEFVLRKASDILLSVPQDDESLVQNSVDFHIAVRYQVQLPDHQSRTLRDGLIVRPVIKSNHSSALVPKPCNMSTTASTKKSVRLSVSTSSSTSITSHHVGKRSTVSSLVQDAARIPKMLSVPMPTVPQDAFRLVDLCGTIRASSGYPPMKSAYGYICDESSTQLRRYNLFPTDVVKGDIDNISLGTILSEFRARQRTLPLENRLYLAVVLASSFLQLSGTGWLPEVVTHHDIFFVKRNRSVSYREPTITKPFTEP